MSNIAHKHLKWTALIKFSALLGLSVLLVSCDLQANKKPTVKSSSLETKIPISSLPIEVAPLFKPGFLEQIASSCKKSARRQSTYYGGWEKFSECKSSIITKYPSIKSFRIHRNKSNAIDAYSFLSIDANAIDYFDDKYGIAFHNYGDYCTKYGLGGIRIFYVVKKELCAALSYRQL